MLSARIPRLLALAAEWRNMVYGSTPAPTRVSWRLLDALATRH